MVNNVIRVVNYVIAAHPSLLNFMIADTSTLSGSLPRDNGNQDQAGTAFARRLPGHSAPYRPAPELLPLSG
jgi:hypothetical protein